jgi:hypothetical protein
MKILSIIVLAAALAGCATTHEITPADKIPVYESATGSPRVATVVKRLWVDSWVTAFSVPSYRSADEAAADLKDHASALGGNGIINFGCYRRTDDPDALLACNGTVVRFK